MNVGFRSESIELPYDEKTYFNGTSLENLGIVVESIHDDLPEARVELVPYTAIRGSRFNGSSIGPREIRLECRAYKDTWHDYEDLKTRLYQLVATDDERKLVLRNHPGQYYLAHYVSFADGERVGGTGIGAFELTFEASDPARIGESRTYVLTGTDMRYFDIGGTADATDMVITVRGTRPSGDNGAFTLKINDRYLSIPAKALDDFMDRIDIYVASRYVVSSSGRIGTTTTSDWPSLKPGRWWVKVTQGSCSSVTFSWKQRYL